MEQEYLVPSPLLAPHRAYYVKEMRIKAYAQLLESYRSLTLERMCRSFGVGEEFMDADLSRFISTGRLNCRIDKVEGTVISDMDKRKGGKGAGWEGLVKQGDLLLNGMFCYFGSLGGGGARGIIPGRGSTMCLADHHRHPEAAPRGRLDELPAAAQLNSAHRE